MTPRRLQDYSAALEERDQKLSAGISQNTDIMKKKSKDMIRYETMETQLKSQWRFSLRDRVASS